jgi:hypothetical protein
MRLLKISALLFMVILTSVALLGCTNGLKPNEATLSFDGTNCTYHGPDVVPAGDMKITLTNTSEYDGDIWIVKLDEGRTWQEMLDFIGVPGSNVHPPEWTDGTIIKGDVPDNPDAQIFQLSKGTYVINCCTCNEILGPKGVWPGAPLEVTE